MKKIFGFLTNRWFLAVLGFLMLAVAIWLIGPLVSIGAWTPLASPMARLLAILVIVLLWGVNEFRKVLKANKANQGMVEGLVEAGSGAEPDRSGQEVALLKERFEQAVQVLKKTKGKGRRLSLYDLPWYIIIGPPGSGKTTALVNSGLDFPLADRFGRESLGGVGGTRNCDWFFTNSAILLDTAGRFMTEDEDRDEWHAFLDILKKHRRRQPINGVIVGMSISDLLESTPEMLEDYAKNMRRRIDELMVRLGIRFPVYLIFTKCDLLDGFVDYFEALNRREREQLWGCTFMREQIEHIAAGGEARAVFEKEFHALQEALGNMRLTRLSTRMKREQRRKVFLFPLQLAAVKEKMADFVGKLFQYNPYQGKDNPSFRGFYFTSGTQEGLPIDRALQAISREFGLPEMPPDRFGGEERKQYFIKDLFGEVVIPDQNFLVGATTAAARAKGLFKLAIMVGSVLALGLFILGVSLAYVDSKERLGLMAQDARAASAVKWPGDLRTNFQLLERLRHRLEHYDDGGPIFSFGMSRAGTMSEAGRRLYFHRLKGFVEEYLYKEFSRRLATYSPGGGIAQPQAYNYLKAYLLMGQEVARLDQIERNFLLNELAALLAERFPRPANSGDHLPTDLQELVNNQLSFFVENLAKKEVQPFSNDANLIKRVRAQIDEPITARSLYENKIKRPGLSSVSGSFTLSNALGGGFPGVFGEHSRPVPNLFTRAGTSGYVLKAIAQESQDPSRDDWVLGNRQARVSAELLDPKRLASDLGRYYFDDYANEWWAFLQAIQYESLGDLRTASDRLKILSDVQNSPVKLILTAVVRETSLDADMVDKTGDVVKSQLSKIGLNIGGTGPAVYPVNPSLTQLHAFVTGAGGAQSELATALVLMGGVSGDLENVAGDQSGSQAKDYTINLVKSSSGGLAEAVKGIRRMLIQKEPRTRQVLATLLESPITSSGGLIINQTYVYLNTLWRSQVYDKFNTSLSGSYPFKKGGPEAPPRDVADFFKEHGVLWGFAEQELQPFFRDASFSQPYSWEGKAFVLSSEAARALEHARALREGLLQGSRVNVSFGVKFEKPVTTESIDIINLSIGGGEKSYELDKPLGYENHAWPGDDDTKGATLKLIDKKPLGGRETVSERKFEGYWGWFKLLSEGRLAQKPGARAEYECQWLLKSRDNDDISLKCSIKASGNVNPFAPEFFARFRCPPELN